ncbi:hypothetical protein [Oceanisphaera pacifica]|uniref:Uncharacterized protein n=1 Tax=Oceanisphaera pacifica TaxID=2818389 RepID=A0ABS3NHS7_9GAMM|nr:hypothetical protein [Oceanisphaera pacifica]MBO1519948.1 hypothetical protein [Oceanisphaera pacifica]
MRNLLPAFFLACAWFWCIGGFLPVLLDHDFSVVAFWVFFTVNITGAALFGFVLDSRRRARFLARFSFLSQLFSVVVIAYHFVFMAWISTLLNSALPITGFIAAGSAFFTLRRKLIGLSVLIFMATLALFVIALSYPAPNLEPIPASDGVIHYVLPLALGFLLAPYFDLTFHRAFAASPNPKVSFFIGFMVLFAILLIGMLYSTSILSAFITGQGLAHAALPWLVGLWVMQMGFTTAAHLCELEKTPWFERKFALPAIIVVGLLCGFHLGIDLLAPELTFAFGDLVYRSLLFIIGVVFPVLLIFGGINARSLIAVAFLTPCYTLGFLVSTDYAPALSLGMAGLAIMMITWRKSLFQQA